MFLECRLLFVGFAAELTDFRLVDDWVDVAHVGVQLCHVEKFAVALWAADGLIEKFPQTISFLRSQRITSMNSSEVFLQA